VDPSRQRRASLTAFLALLLALLVTFLWMAGEFFLPVFIGEVFALLLAPLYGRLLRRRWPRPLAALTLTFGLILLILAPLTGLGVMAAREGQAVVESLQERDVLSRDGLETRLGRLFHDPEAARRRVNEVVQSSAKAGGAVLLYALKAVPRALIAIALALIACYFLLMDGDKMLSKLARALPVEEDVRQRLVDAFRSTTVVTVWASLAAAALQSVLVFAAFMAASIPAPLFAAAVTFVFAWIPVLGSVLVWAAGLIYLIVHGETGRVAVLVSIGVVTAVADHLVRPFILRGRAKIHPLIGLVAILGGVRTFGLFGAFLGPVLAALLAALLDLWPVVGARSGLALDAADASL
jgi:predicted PurR-regulated permease PerM